MKPYDFRKVFIKYVILLSALLLFIYIAIILTFNWQVNQEIHESSTKELKSVQNALDNKQSINEGHPYLVVRNGQIIKNHTRFSKTLLTDQLIKRQQQSFMWNVEGYNFQINSGKLQDGSRVYSLLDMSDYEETKTLLLNLLLVLMVLTLILSLGAAYYIAVKPIRAYEKMLAEHRKFIQNASHELKTPIAAISLGVDYVKALDSAHLSAGSKEALEKIKNEVNYTQQLIVKTLHIAADEDIRLIDVAEVLNDVVKQQQSLQGADITAHYEQPLEYRASPVVVKQMVTILIDNAVKHNDRDIQINVAAEKNKEGLRIEVSDNGRGIEARHINRIFDRYYRGDTRAAGTGIGLALLKDLVQQAGGTIEVKSQQNKKTSFILKI
ncbi:sensor histidine kinase [Macrococcus lamae]|uniref:histidine kinase n=1 Tax=Macrococcus lamae TaxID=198484 RepID=A0A4R6BS47_9STAP|nr:HAMP domain-containing sensor histidine kinase [Macrococcus lamae]TDM05211.1 HAMP domain-containing histidine kinase [Macrococcus lamae]